MCVAVRVVGVCGFLAFWRASASAGFGFALLLIAPECCHNLTLKIGVLNARGGSTLEQWIIFGRDFFPFDDNECFRFKFENIR